MDQLDCKSIQITITTANTHYTTPVVKENVRKCPYSAVTLPWVQLHSIVKQLNYIISEQSIKLVHTIFYKRLHVALMLILYGVLVKFMHSCCNYK